MSHNLDFSLGRAAIAFKANNGKPWHGMGNHITDDMTAEQIAVAAGVNFTVGKAPVTYSIPNPNYNPKDENSSPMMENVFDNRAVLYRSDTGDALSVMSMNSYTPAQPIELLDGLMQLTKGSAYEIDVAGALKGGRVVWALAKRIDVQGDIGGDIIKPYVLLLTSYDGTYARTGRLTSVRVVCQNTVSLSAMMDGKTTAKQRNSAEFDLENSNLLLSNLGQYDSAFADYMTGLKAMAKQRMTGDKLERFFAKLYAPKAFKGDDWLRSDYDFDRKEVTTNQRNNIKALAGIFLDSPGANLASADGTLFGALNAVTFFQDHMARTKEDKRWESATIGNGNRMKDAAMATALEMLGG